MLRQPPGQGEGIRVTGDTSIQEHYYPVQCRSHLLGTKLIQDQETQVRRGPFSLTAQVLLHFLALRTIAEKEQNPRSLDTGKLSTSYQQEYEA